MIALTRPQKFAVGGGLFALLLATRGHHLPSLHDLLPEATWAVFFLAGVYLRQALPFGLLLASAAAVDYVAIAWGGVDDFCISAAYAALLPAYGALWLAGRAYSRRHAMAFRSLPVLAACAGLGALACESISSGGFYLFSGRFADASLAEFALRFAHYFPSSLVSLAIWVALAAQVHVALVLGRSLRAPASGR